MKFGSIISRVTRRHGKAMTGISWLGLAGGLLVGAAPALAQEPVTSGATVHIAGRAEHYEVDAGFVPIRAANGAAGKMFFTGYRMPSRGSE